MKMTTHQRDVMRYAMAPITKVDGGATLRTIESAPDLPRDHFVLVWAHAGAIEAAFASIEKLRGVASDAELREVSRRSEAGDILLTIEVEGQRAATVWLPREPAASA